MAQGVMPSKEAVAKALAANGGIKSKAARAMGIARSTVHDAVRRWPELQDVIDEAAEHMLDDAEEGLAELVKARNLGAVIFALKTKGKRRGYSERVEVTGADGGAVQTRDVSQLSDDELAALARPSAKSGS